VTLGIGPGNFPQVGFVAAGGVFRQRQNLDAITVRGIEAEAAATLGHTRLSASYAYSDARVRAPGLALDGKRPAQSPQHQGSATVAYFADAITASATARYSGARFDDDLQARRLPDALTLDAMASYRVSPDVSIVVRGENLFDARVVSGITATGVEDLGTPRTMWLGLKFARERSR
jgi:vitamin B12 transporter